MSQDENVFDLSADNKANHEVETSPDSRYAVRSGALQLLYVMAQVLQSLYHLLIARLFGPAIYGLYAGALSVVLVLVRLSVFGNDKGMYRFIASYHENQDEGQETRALGSGIKINLLIACLMVVGTILAAQPLARLVGKPEVAPFLTGLAPALLGTSLTITLVAACLARKAAQVPLLVRGIMDPITLTLCAIVAWWFGTEGVRLAYAHSLASLATAGVAILFTVNVFGARKLKASLCNKAHEKFARFVTPIAVLEVINTTRQQADSILILVYLPLESVAFYKASELIGAIVGQIRNAFDGVAAPLFSISIHLNDRERLAENLRFLIRWVATLTLPIATTILALREQILGLFGPEYLAAAGILIIHVMGHMSNGILGLCGHVLMMSGRSRWLIVNQIVALSMNVSLCIWLIPVLGMLGAAIGFAAAVLLTVVANVLETLALERVHPFHKDLLKPFLAALVTLIVQIWVAGMLDSTWLAISLTILSGLGVYLLVWWYLGPGQNERELVEKLWKKLRI